MYHELQELLMKHRAESMITCEEDCICWELEEFLYCYHLKMEAQANTVLQSDKSQSPTLEVDSSEDIIPF